MVRTIAAGLALLAIGCGSPPPESTGGPPPIDERPDAGAVYDGGSGDDVDASPVDAALLDAAPCDAMTMHSDGLTGSWSDCVPRGTHDEAQATAACRASTFAGCHDEAISLGAAVCDGDGQIVCWVYAGGSAGSVVEPIDADAAQPTDWASVGDWD